MKAFARILVGPGRIDERLFVGRAPPLLEDLAAPVATGAPTPCHSEAGKAGLAVVEAPHCSARTGQRGEVEL